MCPCAPFAQLIFQTFLEFSVFSVMPGLPLYALWVAALAVLASPLYIQEFSLPGCTGAVLQSVDVSSSGYCFTLGGEARADVQSFFGLSFGFYSYLATYAYTSCATNDASSSWTATVYGKLGGTGCSSSDVSISGQSFSASQTCWNVGADGYGRSVDTSLLITCGSPSPTSSPSFSPTPSVSASATPSPSVALRYYFQSPDCLGARNDTYFAVGDLTGW